jgi:hypothetical protein
MRRTAGLFLFLVTTLFTLKGYALLFTCQDIPLAGTKHFHIDHGYLIKTRMLHEIPDHQEIVFSELITSNTRQITFAPLDGSPGFFQVTLNNRPQQLAYLLAWVSNHERDGTCAIELQGYRNGDTIREFLQILAIYPEGTLAVGLPNTTDRQGWILIVSDADL